MIFHWHQCYETGLFSFAFKTRKRMDFINLYILCFYIKIIKFGSLCSVFAVMTKEVAAIKFENLRIQNQNKRKQIWKQKRKIDWKIKKWVSVLNFQPIYRNRVKNLILNQTMTNHTGQNCLQFLAGVQNQHRIQVNNFQKVPKVLWNVNVIITFTFHSECYMLALCYAI